MKSIVITGTSTGIGYACSKNFIEKGYKVFGSVRNENVRDDGKSWRRSKCHS